MGNFYIYWEFCATDMLPKMLMWGLSGQAKVNANSEFILFGLDELYSAQVANSPLLKCKNLGSPFQMRWIKETLSNQL